jgi:hypothetical protein
MREQASMGTHDGPLALISGILLIRGSRSSQKKKTGGRKGKRPMPGRRERVTLPLLSSMTCLLTLSAGPLGVSARTGFVLQRALGVPGYACGQLRALGRSACPATRRSTFGGADDDGGQRTSKKAALRALWKIRGAALEKDSTALKATQEAQDEEEPSSLLPPSAYDDLPPLPNAIGQQQSMDYASAEEEYTFDGVKRAGTVTIIGAPNAGKSTLLNYLVGSKIAIVTHKRQTTRQSITGIAMEGGTQVVYIDTPGIMAPR